MWGRLTLKINGLNQARLIDNLIAWKIKIYKLDKLSPSQLILITDKTSYINLLGKTKNMCYTINVEKVTGLMAFLQIFKHHIALFVALILMLIGMFIASNFIFRIDVYGIDRIDRAQVLEVLVNNDVKVGKNKNTINTDDIERQLYSTIDDIGLVSVIIKGTTIVVNIEEKLAFESSQFTPVVAKSDGIITDIVIITGTPLVKIGDVVKKGDTLVAPYYIDGQGVQQPITAVAEVYATVEASGSVDVKNEIVVNNRTGKKASYNSFILFGKEFLANKQIPYEDYEVEYYDTYVASNSWLPLIKRTTTYYEVQKTKVNVNYDDEREEAINKATDIAYESLDDDTLQIIDKKIVESQYQDGTIVTCYLKLYKRLDI